MPKVVAQKEEWIKLGFKLFAEKGETGIVVDQMATKLKCNRSSFYWHFNSKEEFIDQVIQFWVEMDTDQIIQLTNNEGATKRKFRKLISLTFRKDPYMDFVFHIKRYALKRKKVQKIIDEIDEKRIQYTEDLISELGISRSKARVQARIAYNYLIGYHEMMRYKDQAPDYAKNVLSDLRQFIHL